MSSVDISLIRTIQREAEDYIGPLHEVLGGATEEQVVDLLAGDLVMIAVFFSGVDNDVAYEERNAINDLRRALYAGDMPTIDESESTELYRRFVRLYPGRIISVDCLPLTLLLLQEYDARHGTNFAQRASDLFKMVGEAVVKLDRKLHVFETITLSNFRELLSERAYQAPKHDSE